MPDYSHCIIVGVNKCGTTSLYRYLADHPEVCASKVKETRYFLEYVTPDSDLSYDNYLRHFDRRNSTRRVLVEASPGYFTSGAGVAQRMAAVLPDAKLVVMLRNPVDRLFSYYRSAQVYDNYAAEMLAGYSFDDFAREAVSLSQAPGPREEKRAEFVRAIRQGNYAAHAENYHTVFPESQIMYIFFEDFCRVPGECMMEISRFLGISDDYYEGYDCTVENRTRSYRITTLHRLAFRINMACERFLNRYPALRQRLRSLYLRINEDKGKQGVPVSQETRDLLDAFYHDQNQRMQALLTRYYPSVVTPDWLH